MSRLISNAITSVCIMFVGIVTLVCVSMLGGKDVSAQGGFPVGAGFSSQVTFSVFDPTYGLEFQKLARNTGTNTVSSIYCIVEDAYATAEVMLLVDGADVDSSALACNGTSESSELSPDGAVSLTDGEYLGVRFDSVTGLTGPVTITVRF